MRLFPKRRILYGSELPAVYDQRHAGGRYVQLDRDYYVAVMLEVDTDVMPFHVFGKWDIHEAPVFGS